MLVSGTGSNLQAIIDGIHGRGVEIVGVASNKPGAKGLERAAAAGIATSVFPRDEFADRAERDCALGDWVDESGAELVVLAGYMELLSPGFVQRFSGRIINVHPALLPSFPGLDAIGQAIDAGVRLTGVTVHFVDEGVDSGPIILQRAVELPYTRDRAELEEEIHRVEHELLPRAIELVARGAVRFSDTNPKVVLIDEHANAR